MHTHDHDHDHDHDHHHHGHGHHHDTSSLSDARLIGTFLLNASLTVIEVVVGVLSGSVSLIADGVHNLGDAFSLLIAYFARRIARREADLEFSFGYRRAETVGAVINLSALIVMGFFLVAESLERLFAPQPIEAMWVIVAASAALVVDLLTVGLLFTMSKGNLNLRAAFIHNLTDAAASVVVIIGAIFIEVYGWTWVDPILGLMIAAYILVTSVSMLRRAATLLMNSSPPGLDVTLLIERASSIDGVAGVHHVHIWELDETKLAMEAHVVLSTAVDLEQAQAIRARVRKVLHSEFRIEHATLELEPPDHACVNREC